MPRVALVTGTGLDALPIPLEPVVVETPRRDVTVGVARDGDLTLFVLPRHGAPAVPAHAVDHRANVEALARCRVDGVLALNSVGALDEALAPGTLLVPDDWLDLAQAAGATFHDDEAVHVDVAEAYCPTLRALLVAAAREAGAPVADGGVYAATRGPRLETRAESRALRILGGTVVGMTGGAEAALARERALCYASLCLVTNLAPGVRGERPTAVRIQGDARRMGETALAAALAAARRVPAVAKACACPRALDEARL